MGITKNFHDYEQDILKILRMKYDTLLWCELGNQSFYTGNSAKKYYESKGVMHTSIDINGKDGALPIDLDNTVPSNLENKFDIITNYGTTEHINNQYQVFKNIHVMCKQNGIMIHAIPLIKNWPKHCRYYYSILFFQELSNYCNYQIIDLQILNKDYYKFPNNLVVSVLKKKEENNFITKDKFDQINGIQDSKNLKNTGNYSK
jgi:hypothetical protein